VKINYSNLFVGVVIGAAALYMYQKYGAKLI
jgi:hypothetical protein